jgi:hypothetical protein
MENVQLKSSQIKQTLMIYTGMLLDAVEHSVCEAKDWPQLRARLLKILGERGLAGRVTEIMISDVEKNSGAK